MGYAEWGATLFSLIYLYYAIKNKPICFIYGIIGSGVWAFVSYGGHYIFDAALYYETESGLNSGHYGNE